MYFITTKFVWLEAQMPSQWQTCLYLSTLTPSSWLRRTRFVPTRIRSSCLSFSLFSRSRLWPWCCIRTQSLFISAKLSRTKSMESLMSPVISSVPLWVDRGRGVRGATTMILLRTECLNQCQWQCDWLRKLHFYLSVLKNKWTLEGFLYFKNNQLLF